MSATLAHLSDLHLGASRAGELAARRMVEQLLIDGIDHVVVTGDLTDSGRFDQWELFREIFAPLERTGRLTIVPGNHDRGNDDVAALMMRSQRVRVRHRPGLTLVRVDSTAPHNSVPFRSHGDVCTQTLAAIDEGLATAPSGAVVALLLHHHPVRLPVEGVGEWFANAFGWPHASELKLGRQLLASALGRCDLVLHGHRHLPRHFHAAGRNGRPLHVYNAGSSTELGACRVFQHHGGELLGAPTWVRAVTQRGHGPITPPVPLPALS